VSAAHLRNMAAMNVAQLILDYGVICEKRGQLVDVAEFVEVWKAADALMQAGTNAGLDGEDISALLLRDEED
jgi:hypothetical protein